MSNQISLWFNSLTGRDAILAQLATYPPDVFEDVPEAELSVYATIFNSLQEVFERNYADCTVLKPLKKSVDSDKPLKPAQHTSVFFFGETFFRLCFRGKRHDISIPSKYAKMLPDGIDIIETKTKDDFCKINIPDTEALATVIPTFCQLAEMFINGIKKEFDCCSRYEQCSDAKKCIHADMRRSMSCGYKKILKNGHIFYGTNRNV